ncbi:MAG: NAD(P)-binding domain-containing protein, partial [Blastococcus sp.]
MPAARRTFRAAGLPSPAAAPARLRVGIVGAGRVGAVLGAALSAAGHDVVAAAGLSTASAERAARLLPGVPLLPADEVVAAADLVVLAVPDDTLPGLVAGLAETGVWRAGQLTFHTS